MDVMGMQSQAQGVGDHDPSVIFVGLDVRPLERAVVLALGEYISERDLSPQLSRASGECGRRTADSPT